MSKMLMIGWSGLNADDWLICIKCWWLTYLGKMLMTDWFGLNADDWSGQKADDYWFGQNASDWLKKMEKKVQTGITEFNGSSTFQLLPKTAGELVIWPNLVRKSSWGKPLKLPHKPQTWLLKLPGMLTSAWLSPFQETWICL